MFITQKHRLKSLFAIMFFLGFPLCLQPAYAAKAKGGFSSKEIRSILPLLQRHGVVSLVETAKNGGSEAMTLAVRINAPRDVTFKIFENPENFYYISTLFKENKVLQEHTNVKAWSWASRHSFFSFTGRNIVSLFPPRRADVSIAKSTIGNGNYTLMFYEDGKDHTILVISGFLDVQTSEWLIRYLLGGNPSMRKAMNIAIGLVMVKGIKAMAERDALGKPLDKHRVRGKAGGCPELLSNKDLVLLAPLLVRGQVIITDSRKHGRLKQATVVDTINASSNKVINAVSKPANYGRMIKAISDITVHSAKEDKIVFSWALGFSIFNLTSQNNMTTQEKGVMIEAMDGELKGSFWRWQIEPISKNKTIVAYHGFTDVGNTTYILKKTVKREPYLEHGIVAGSNIIMLRAMKKIVESK